MRYRREFTGIGASPKGDRRKLERGSTSPPSTTPTPTVLSKPPKGLLPVACYLAGRTKHVYRSEFIRHVLRGHLSRPDREATRLQHRRPHVLDSPRQNHDIIAGGLSALRIPWTASLARHGRLCGFPLAQSSPRLDQRPADEPMARRPRTPQPAAGAVRRPVNAPCTKRMMRVLTRRVHDHSDDAARHSMQVGASVTLRPPITPQLANRLERCCLH